MHSSNKKDILRRDLVKKKKKYFYVRPTLVKISWFCLLFINPLWKEREKKSIEIEQFL